MSERQVRLAIHDLIHGNLDDPFLAIRLTAAVLSAADDAMQATDEDVREAWEAFLDHVGPANEKADEAISAIEEDPDAEDADDRDHDAQEAGDDDAPGTDEEERE